MEYRFSRIDHTGILFINGDCIADFVGHTAVDDVINAIIRNGYPDSIRNAYCDNIIDLDLGDTQVFFITYHQTRIPVVLMKLGPGTVRQARAAGIYGGEFVIIRSDVDRSVSANGRRGIDVITGFILPLKVTIGIDGIQVVIFRTHIDDTVGTYRWRGQNVVPGLVTPF